ncbi:YbhB/YbcL family Raf kinase inhibitor-like protein [Nocardioides carbamazepini]|uniref:YbhB/YbcL family Raf kinase inhibitor-like protein n=1 Tax=Nocardioides carbamazepini TaxID=2854259 RepID=UPI00214A6121|nr:YbhB/YbcL family Raf kinase inhibitor-like protein [Nocardioides carbamazepini]MCR1783995.1 YbhB/YbcL family Raf kinase inhibitor-like protein [Nocardioides carbamazepini]
MSKLVPDDPYAAWTPAPGLDVTSADLVHGAEVPLPFRDPEIGGSHISPQLSWSGFPEGTRSFAITCYDPDAPTGVGFMHWAVANIPADVTSLARGAGTADGMPAGSLTLPNDVRMRQYVGPNPPPGSGRHRYVFLVHAVDVPVLTIPADLTPTVLGFNLHFHTLARGHLTGWVDSVTAG